MESHAGDKSPPLLNNQPNNTTNLHINTAHFDSQQRRETVFY